MAFSQATITQVFAPRPTQTHVFISWASSSPSGTWFQVYVNQQLAWSGTATYCLLPIQMIPPGPARIDIGTVAVGEETISFASSLPSAPSRRVQLSWQSGTYNGADLAGFRIYSSASPGGVIDYTTPLATITAYPSGITMDGFGFGGFGGGGFGQAPGTYTWTSDPLAAGTWSFAIVSFDAAGNAGPAQTTTSTVSAPPREPAFFADGITRLTYTLNGAGQTGFGSGGFGLPTATLTWNPSPP
jgi:hypothetical protein